MISNWSEVVFDDLYSIPSRNGLTRPRSVRGTGVKMVNMKEIFSFNRIHNQQMELVPLSEKEAVNNLLEKGDLLFARQSLVLEGAGKCSYILDIHEPMTFESHLIRVRLNKDKVNPEFYYYYFSSPTGLGKIRSLVNQVAAAGIRGSELAKLKVDYPPIAIQNKIASILSTYDDLIENNNRRIAILEEMARSLYREWFVKFRFPGHEEVKIVDSELGQIPEGWEVKHLENVIDINRGRSYKSSELVEEGGLPFLNLKNIARDGGFRRDGLKWYNGPYKPVQTACANDIIMAVTDMTQERAVIARPARVPKMGFDMFVLSMDLIKITAKLDYDNGFVYCLLRYSQFSDEVKQFANGANVLHLSPSVIEKYLAILPPATLQTKFYTIVQGLHRLQDNLAIKNDNLKTQRDMLLPKLISGKMNLQILKDSH